MLSIKKITAMLLAVIIIAVGLPFCAAAETEEEYIYLSDIYYAYSTYISKSQLMDIYCDNTLDCMYLTLDNYLKSDAFHDTETKTALSTTPNPVDYIKLFLSGYFGADYVKNDAVDLANQLFIQSVLNTGAVENVNTANSIGEKVVKLCKVYDAYDEWLNGTEATDSEILQKAIDMLTSSGMLKSLSSSKLNSLLSKVTENMTTVSNIASIGSDMVKLGKALMLVGMMEDARLEIVDVILEYAPSDSTLYDGMTRLKSDMDSNWVTYAFNTYIGKGIIGDLADKVLDKLVGAVVPDGPLLFAVVGIIMELSAEIIFADTPNLNDIMLQMVLTDYTSGMQQVVYAFDDKFDGEKFTSNDVNDHGKLVAALQAVTDLALSKTKPLAVYESDLNTLTALQSKYSDDFDLYNSVIADVRATLKAIPAAERKRTYFDSWTISASTTAEYGSDVLEDGKLYFTDGVFSGNVRVGLKQTFTVPEDRTLTVDGNVTLSYQSYGSEGSSFVNNGDFTITGNYVGSASYICYTTNNGNLNIRGDAAFGTLTMTEEDTILTVGGNVSGLKATAGTVILNGTEQQELSGYVIKCHNITVLNKAGVKYNSSLNITGTYLLNGNTLDNNGYYTCADSANVRFDSISDYKQISINCDLTIDYNIKANILVNGRNTLRVAEDSTVVIDGNVKLNYQSYGSEDGNFANYGDTIITGSFSGNTSSECDTTNNGNLTVYGDAAFGTLTMTEEDTTLTVGGNVSGLEATGGTVILNGTEQQQLSGYNINCHNLTVLNEAGIKYNSTLYVTGTYLLNGYPLDNNGYYTYANSANVKFDSISDYKKININTSLEIGNSVTGDITVGKSKSLTITEGSTVVIDGNVTLDYQSSYGGGDFYNYGDTTITGSFYSSASENVTTNNGNLTVYGDATFSVMSMTEEDATLTVGGYFSSSHSGIKAGTVILNGTEQQEIGYLNCHNVEVRNPAGIKYSRTANITGYYYLNGYPLDNSDYYTYANSANVKFDSISDYKKININTSLEIGNSVTGDITVGKSKSLTIPEGSTVVIDGNVTLDYQSSYGGGDFYNYGDTTITGSFSGGSSSENVTTNSGNLTVLGDAVFRKFSMSEDGTTLTVGGNVRGVKATAGTVILNGTEQQQLSGSNMSCHNLTVLNEAGIKYGASLYVTGSYLLNGYPLDNNGYYTYANSENVSFDSVSDYKEIYINQSLKIENSIKGNIKVGYWKTLTIPEDSTVVIDGNVTLDYQSPYGGGDFYNCGNTTITGSFSGSSATSISNSGNLTVLGDAAFGTFSMPEENAALTVGGNLSASTATVTKGDINVTGNASFNNLTVNNPSTFILGGNLTISYTSQNSKTTLVLNGIEAQTVSGLGTVDTLILENESEGGVVFNSAIRVNTLFDHKGNNFTLYNGGSNSTFADFDGDWATDQKDDEPTVAGGKYICELMSDVNFDGETDVLDFIRIKKDFAAGDISDYNLDDSADAGDVVFVKKTLLGIYDDGIVGRANARLNN